MSNIVTQFFILLAVDIIDRRWQALSKPNISTSFPTVRQATCAKQFLDALEQRALPS